MTHCQREMICKINYIVFTPVFAGLVRDRYCICFIQNDFQQFCFMTATNTTVFWYDTTVTVIISAHAQTSHLLRVQNEFQVISYFSA